MEKFLCQKGQCSSISMGRQPPEVCGVSSRDRKHSVDLYSLLGMQSLADVARRGRMRWFGYLEHKSEDDRVSAVEMWRWVKTNYKLGVERHLRGVKPPTNRALSRVRSKKT